MKLNLGCGSNKIADCINVDGNKSVNPDVVADLKEPLPFKNDEVDEVYMFHIMEHIEKKFHGFVLQEVHRILKPEGRLIMSFPNFRKVIQNWLDNHLGHRDFWEATIFGRQLYPGDYHYCGLDESFRLMVIQNGFKDVNCFDEPNEPFNLVISARKGNFIDREGILKKAIFGDKS